MWPVVLTGFHAQVILCLFVSAFKNESHRIITHVDSVKHVGVNSEEGAT